MTRRHEIAEILPRIIGHERGGDPVAIAEIYAAIEQDRPELVDDEIEATTGAVRWKHDVRWEIETLVSKGAIKRRKDLGRGVYSL